MNCHNPRPSLTLNQRWHHRVWAGPWNTPRRYTLARRLCCLLPGDRLNDLLQTLAKA